MSPFLHLPVCTELHILQDIFPQTSFHLACLTTFQKVIIRVFISNMELLWIKELTQNYRAS